MSTTTHTYGTIEEIKPNTFRSASPRSEKARGKQRADCSSSPAPSSASASPISSHLPCAASQQNSVRRRIGDNIPLCIKWLGLDNVSLELENSGSVARDHLAAERTFLAYIRTSLACAAAGVALIQLLMVSAVPAPPKLRLCVQLLGAVIVLFGVAIVLIAVTRYFRMQRLLIVGRFPTAGGPLLAIAGGMFVLVCLAFGFVLAFALS